MIDLAIVGGGAAGIGAAHEARSRGINPIILEASDRIGGRAHSVGWQGHALDLGAGWLHSANRNPLVALAERSGFEVDRSPSTWRAQFRDLGFSRAEQADSRKALGAFEERITKNPPPGDRASDALDPDCEWNGFLDALSGYINGASLSRVSAADWVAYWDEAGESNWRVAKGYGTLIAALAGDVRTGCVVRRVEWGRTVRIATNQGTLEAARAIVAVPTSVLASGGIAFDPPLDDRLHAASQLPLGHVEKLFFALDGQDATPNDAHLIGKPRQAETGSYMLRPMGMPVVECFFGGDWVEGMTADDLAATARDELGALVGSEFGRSLRAIVATNWQRHSLIRGSYSYARPKHHGARATLAAALDGPLAFAGEACSEADFATVHGAWESGRAAVAQLFG